MLNCFNSRFKTISSTQAAAIVAAIAFLLYLPALQFQFVNWDDVGYVTSNEAFAYHWRDFLSWAFTTFQQGNWHPLTWISLKIDHSLWALNPLGYHLTNIVLHAGNSFLVVVLMWRLFRMRTGEGSVSRVLEQLGMIEKARDAYARFVELATPEYQEQIEQALIRIKQIGSVKQP